MTLQALSEVSPYSALNLSDHWTTCLDVLDKERARWRAERQRFEADPAAATAVVEAAKAAAAQATAAAVPNDPVQILPSELNILSFILFSVMLIITFAL